MHSVSPAKQSHVVVPSRKFLNHASPDPRLTTVLLHVALSFPEPARDSPTRRWLRPCSARRHAHRVLPPSPSSERASQVWRVPIDSSSSESRPRFMKPTIASGEG